MTLLEIMIVLVILGMITGIVTVNVLNSQAKAQRETAAIQIKQIGDALEFYRLSFHSYPSTAEGLQALVTPKNGAPSFMREVPQDPWDREYVYIYPGSGNQGGFDLISYGPDGVQSADDITNAPKARQAQND